MELAIFLSASNCITSSHIRNRIDFHEYKGSRGCRDAATNRCIYVYVVVSM